MRLLLMRSVNVCRKNETVEVSKDCTGTVQGKLFKTKSDSCFKIKGIKIGCTRSSSPGMEYTMFTCRIFSLVDIGYRYRWNSLPHKSCWFQLSLRE